jgi:Cyclic nucleotide-binding domain
MARVVVKARKKHPFDVEVFLNTVGEGRSVLNYRKNQKVFSQGDPADSVFYIQEGKVKVRVVSDQGKEAVVALHGSGDFFGEGCLNGHRLRMATVVTMTRHHAHRKVIHGASASRRAKVLRDVHIVPIVPELPSRGGLGRPTLQFKREASGESASLDGELWEGGKAGAGHTEVKPRDAR